MSTKSSGNRTAHHLQRAAERQWRGLMVTLIGLLTFPTGCLETQGTRPAEGNECTACHGDALRAGDPIIKSAPPFDLNGNRDPSARGVGAHLNHLVASPTHEVVGCNECHVVPAKIYDDGHFGDANGPRITFGDSARSHGLVPVYDSTNASCSNTYCHQMYAPSNTPDWQAPKDSSQACGSCHGLPPSLPHPQNADCSVCHGEVVDPDRGFRNRALHLDGKVQVAPLCGSCHGGNQDGAPPPDLSGSIEVSAPGVGAHQRHLQASETHGPAACSDCHPIPLTWDSPGHLDQQRPADVRFPLAFRGSDASYSPETRSCSNTYCHQNALPVWTEQRAPADSCGSCHALPPPFVVGLAIGNGNHPKSDRCEKCHGSVIGPGRVFAVPERHVDGVIDVLSLTCTSCHGSDGSSAPPNDLSGAAEVAAIGVGAHRAHLGGGSLGRPVPCSECHVVPEHIDDPGHIDDWAVAEVKFAGAAVAQNRAPTWDRQTGRCTNVWCHAADNTVSSSPVWADPGVSLGCTGCHGMPPPTPHVQLTQCSLCHSNMKADGTFVARTQHVNGAVDF